MGLILYGGVKPMISKLFGAMLGVVVGLALTPIVIDVVDNLVTTYGSSGTNTLGTAETLVELIPLFYVIIIIVGAVAYIKFKV